MANKVYNYFRDDRDELGLKLENLTILDSKKQDDLKRGQLFKDEAYQVQIEEKYEREEKRKFTQRDIRVRVDTPGEKVKIDLMDLRRSLPSMKRGESLQLQIFDKEIYLTFDKITNESIIFFLTRKSWGIYQTMGGEHTLYSLSMGHNPRIYVSKVKACLEVSGNSNWLDSLLPEDITSDDEAANMKPILDVDHLNKDDIVCDNKSLNIWQKDAIINMLKAQNRPYPYVLFGPPGTGKTTTIAELVIQIYKRSDCRVLICANSNVCVEGLAERIANYGIIEEGNIVRLVAANRELIEEGLSEAVRNITMEGYEFKNLEKMPRVVLATCQKSSMLRDIERFSYEFDFVIVDEVGHSQEPETLIPYLLCKPEGSVIFAGDPHQLQPVSKSRETPLLKQSTLVRLFQCKLYKKRRSGTLSDSRKGYDPRYITKLLGCHRSDPRIMRVCNRLFYEDELVCKHGTPQELLDIFETKDPLLFCPTWGVEGKLSPDDTSFMNKIEASRCVNFVKLLYLHKFKPESIGIIAAYRSQVTHISSLFQEHEIDHCKVASIDEFQGEERRVIIISTVRSGTGKSFGRPKSIGFLKEYQRFNVAISRARELVIVVGDPDVLKTDKNWASYVEDATEVNIETG